MMDANYISERLGSMRQEISDLRVTTARYWSKDEHTALEKSAFALRKGRLLEIKRGSVGHDEALCLNAHGFRRHNVRSIVRVWMV